MVTNKVLFLSLFIYITTIIVLFSTDSIGSFAWDDATSVVMLCLGLGVIYLLIVMGIKKTLLFSSFGLDNTNLLSILKVSGPILGVMFIFIISIFGIFSFVKNPPVSKAFFSIFNVIIFIITLLLLLYIIKDYHFTNKYLHLIKSVIYYIPCLIYDFIDWAKYQYSITTPTSLIILGIDIAVIIVNGLWNKLKIFYQHNKNSDNILLEGPVYLNEKHNLGTFEDMKVAMKNKNYSYRYSLSFWIYINPQPPSTSAAYSEYTTLFDYGGKPTLLYKADDNQLKIQVVLNDEDTKNIYLGNDMKLQKWNHFIINYDGGTLDIILNDKLISSSGSIAPYMTLDIVSVGHNHGINGGIRDVVYFRNPVI